jgi:amino acid adenylation domain-containing protein
MIDPKYAGPAVPQQVDPELLARVVSTWCEVLALHDLNEDDDFLSVGGDSLAAAQIVARLAPIATPRLPLTAVLESRTPRALAGLLDRSKHSDGRSSGRSDTASSPVTYPATDHQARLWFQHVLDPTSIEYNVTTRWLLSGPLSVPFFTAAISDVIARHDALRTTFDQVGEAVVARVTTEAPRVETVDLRGAADTEAALTKLLVSSSTQVFDLTKGPLFRPSLVRLSDDSYLFSMAMHHIVMDEWSLRIIYEDISRRYAARAVGGHDVEPAGWGDAYARYAFEHQSLDQEPSYQDDIEYWSVRLADAPPIDLPTDRSRPAVRSGNGDIVRFDVPKQVAERLAGLGAQNGATVFMAGAAAFAILLHRLSGSGDVVFGTTSGGRFDVESENLVGYVVNPLALRVDVQGEDRFLDVLRKTREVCLGALAHRNAPFDKVIRSLNLPRSLDRAPLFQTLFELNDDVSSLFSLPGVVARPYEGPECSAKYDMSISLTNSANGMRGLLEYSTDLFETATAQSLARAFTCLLRDASVQPEARVGQLRLIDAEEELAVVNREYASLSKVPEQTTLDELFRRTAAVNGSRPAVCRSDGTVIWTYDQLSDAVDTLASEIAELAAPGDVIGLAHPPSATLIALLLAAGRAGCAYVPIDPSHPDQRIRTLLADARPTLLAAQSGPTADRLVALSGVSALRVPADRAIADLRTRPRLKAGRSTASSVAYIMYTSGSTGSPKGVVIQQQALCNYLLWAEKAYQGRRLGPAPFIGSVIFDLTVPNIFVPLICGEPVIVLPEGEEVMSLADILTRGPALGFVKMTPAHADAVRELIPAGTVLSSVGTLAIGADEVRPETVRALNAMLPESRVFNEYGPTETTVGCSAYLVDNGLALSARVPIGRAIDGMTMLVLDADLRPVPPGAVGEIYIGGIGVAVGYLNRPALTADRFVPDPFHPRGGARLYRSGDRARVRPDWHIEFLGRTDAQIKLRGYRIEPSEIEYHLLMQPAISQAVVAVRNSRAGEPQLVAYTVPTPGHSVDETAIVEDLRQRIPDYMVPGRVVALHRLPLTEAGKVDRKNLPEVEDYPVDDAPLVGETEHALAEIWCEILKLPSVSPRDDFFRSGGDSILSLTLVSRARLRGLRLSPRDIFASRSLRELAAICQANVGATDARPRRSTTIERWPATPIQEWMLDQNLQEPSHYNQSVRLRLAGTFDKGAVKEALGVLLERHGALSTKFVRNTDGGHTQTVAGVRHDILHLGGRMEDTDTAELYKAVNRELDIWSGEMVRAVLTRSNAETETLWISANHLVTDVVSWTTLVEDFATAYRQLISRSDIDLPSPGDSFGQWALDIDAFGRSGTALREAAYWRGISSADTLRSSSNQYNTYGNTEEICANVGRPVTDSLLRDSRLNPQLNILDMIIASAAVGLRRELGSSHFQVDVEGHGRERLLVDGDFARTVGWFASVYPIEIDLAQKADLSALAGKIHDVRMNLPRGGVAFGAVRGDHPGIAFNRDARRSAVVINYVPHLYNNFTELPFDVLPTEESIDRSPRNARFYEIELLATLENDGLVLKLSYCPDLHSDEKARRILEETVTALRTGPSSPLC